MRKKLIKRSSKVVHESQELVVLPIWKLSSLRDWDTSFPEMDYVTLTFVAFGLT